MLFFYRKSQKPDNAREKATLNKFIANFMEEGIPAHLSTRVYEYFQQWMYDENFRVLPDDDIYGTYGMADEDLDDAVLKLAKEAGCPTPTNQAVKDMPPVRTVRDLVHLLWKLHL